MQVFFRHVSVLFATVGLLFYCSCERHKASELEHGDEHARSKAGEHERVEGAHKHTDRDKARATDQNRATTAMSVTPAARTSPTPADFFPSATPH